MTRKRIGLLMLLMSSSYPAEADNSSPLHFDLTNGKTILIGKVIEEKGGNRYFVTRKKWTLGPDKIRLHDQITARLSFVKVGNLVETHIYAAFNETGRDGVLKNGSFLVVPVAYDKAQMAIKKLALKKDFKGEINPSWQFCESDNECIQSRNYCGNLIGVNKNYEKDYLSFLKSKKAKVDCSKTEKSKFSVSKCVDNFCS